MNTHISQQSLDSRCILVCHSVSSDLWCSATHSHTSHLRRSRRPRPSVVFLPWSHDPRRSTAWRLFLFITEEWGGAREGFLRLHCRSFPALPCFIHWPLLYFLFAQQTIGHPKGILQILVDVACKGCGHGSTRVSLTQSLYQIPFSRIQVLGKCAHKNCRCFKYMYSTWLTGILRLWIGSANQGSNPRDIKYKSCQTK